MDSYKVPIGFGMALAVNEPAMNAYSNLQHLQICSFIIFLDKLACLG